jgi:transcriptional regulator with XRE-family HTH domain
MRTLQKTPAAVLRKILRITDHEMADKLKRSVHTIRSIESGRLKLTRELATKMFHETGISPDWLLNGDPTAPPISASGQEYKREEYDRAQARKIHYDQPHPIFRNNDALGVCARLIAILESASAGKDYYMALYKVHTALDSLQGEFGIDEKAYQHSGPHSMNATMAVRLFKQVLARHKELEEVIKKVHRPAPKQKSKRPSTKKRHR